ncbi:ankyrin 2,3/unc44 [Culex quinquefasciatus]|uniref:Ankyrin 2,3/unc44 n=1 Tax=Culex quinquefasciatus TaxID=7176 RepID=B0XD56_CULQU|nr:ankyrin 2,3/unc44 [Culex quinquefasciatus]|eukprot:XP_001867578.1 ankyrin 2,3/unc44 [Culex quinquefasciatus]
MVPEWPTGVALYNYCATVVQLVCYLGFMQDCGVGFSCSDSKVLISTAQPIDPDLTAKLLGRGVAVSPVVTVEPRRRKFHKAITLSMPAPRAHSQGMINQYSGNAPTLRLLCSITAIP